jgi:hypothetical protein
MKVALKVDLRKTLASLTQRGNPLGPPRPYWFQYEGQGSGDSRTVFLVGYSFPAPPDAATKFYGAVIPEACHVSATYMPNTESIKDMTIGGFDCPQRI